MQYYSVRQFCDMVGVPYSSLRYYERIGLLKPKQDEQNNYRAYTPKDAFMVNRFKFYRSLGFEVKEAIGFIENEDETYFINKMNEQELNIKKQMFMLQNQLTTVRSIKDNIRRAKNEENYELGYLKDKLFLPASQGKNFSVSTYDRFSKWVDLLPITTYCKMINKDDFINASLTDEKELVMHYGIAINEEDAHLLDHEEREKAKKLKGGQCIIFYSNKFNYAMIDKGVVEEVKSYIKEQGLEISGDIFLEGARITINKFGKGNIIYIPVKESD